MRWRLTLEELASYEPRVISSETMSGSPSAERKLFQDFPFTSLYRDHNFGAPLRDRGFKSNISIVGAVEMTTAAMKSNSGTSPD